MVYPKYQEQRSEGLVIGTVLHPNIQREIVALMQSKGNLAYQTFFSVLFMGKEENDFLNIFQCCFMNAPFDDRIVRYQI